MWTPFPIAPVGARARGWDGMDACGAELEEPDWEHGEKGEALYVGHYIVIRYMGMAKKNKKRMEHHLF